MPIFALPWWPPSGNDRLSKHQVRQLFAYLRTVTPPVMAEGKRRIREITGPDEPIRIRHLTVKDLTDKRLGTFLLDVLKVIHMGASTPLERNARFAIGLHRDGALVVTPNLNPATHLFWDRWSPPEGATAAPA